MGASVRRRANAIAVAACACSVLIGCHSPLRRPGAGRLGAAIASRPTAPAVVDPTTLNRKLMFGYQGWFACPGDGSPLGAWEHWFVRGQPARAATLRVDMWPDVSELSADERCDTPLTLRAGSPAQLYSAFNPKTVNRHFRWMREYHLAGVFLQRFTLGLRTPAVLGFRDAVARNVQSAAESNGRVFAMMYDISGHARATVVDDVKRDWVHLVDTLHITSSPQYLHHRGRPLLAIWGLGFEDRAPTADQAAELIEFFRNHPDPRYRVTLLGGVPSRWRTLSRDSQTDPAGQASIRSFDIISPWTVGRFRMPRGSTSSTRRRSSKDLAETRRLGSTTCPSCFRVFLAQPEPRRPLQPHSTSGGRSTGARWSARCGRSTMLYGAMFDEVDEGTAMFKVAASRASAGGAADGHDWTRMASGCRATGTCGWRVKHRRPCSGRRAPEGDDRGAWHASLVG